VKNALAIADHHIANLDAFGEQQGQQWHVDRAGADQRDLEFIPALAHDPEGVDQTGEDDCGGSLLVIVPDGDLKVWIGPQRVQHLEALGLRDVLQVDPTKGWLEPLGGLHDFVGILSSQTDRDGIHAAQVLEEQRLALHQGQTGHRADIPLGESHLETLDPRAVGDDGHRVALAAVLVCQVGVFLDRQTGGGDAGRVPDGKVVHDVMNRTLGSDLHLASIQWMQAHRILGWLLGFGQ
jgi:hypothetical protein